MVWLFTPELQNLVEGDNNMTFRSPKIDNFLSRLVILCQKDTCSSWTIFCPALTKFCQVRLLLWQNIGTLRSKKDFRRGDMCWHMLASINSWKDFTQHTHFSEAKKLAFHTYSEIFIHLKSFYLLQLVHSSCAFSCLSNEICAVPLPIAEKVIIFWCTKLTAVQLSISLDGRLPTHFHTSHLPHIL